MKIIIGSTIWFGDYEWIVLDIVDEKALLITKHIISQGSYHNKYEGVTWEDSSIRKYLNSDFLKIFNNQERKRIARTNTRNLDNQWHHSNGGSNTEDFVFLLSIEEVACRYFGDSCRKLHNPGKNQRYWLERKDANKHKRVATLLSNQNQAWWWWLRSPGRFNVRVAYVHGDGNIGIQGNNVLKGNSKDGRCTGGIRPAMWINI